MTQAHCHTSHHTSQAKPVTPVHMWDPNLAILCLQVSIVSLKFLRPLMIFPLMVPFFKMVTMPLAIRSHKLNEMLSFRPPSTKGAKPLAATVRNEELDMFTSMSL